ncbi:MAG: hypothetical protein Q9169_008205 [Polycauliona sp. 2 TL-2023]
MSRNVQRIFGKQGITEEPYGAAIYTQASRLLAAIRSQVFTSAWRPDPPYLRIYDVAYTYLDQAIEIQELVYLKGLPELRELDSADIRRELQDLEFDIYVK